MAATYKLADLAATIAAELRGDGNCVITHLAPLDQAQTGSISFLENPSYKKYLETTNASAVIVTAQHAVLAKCAALITPNPYLAYAKVSALFDLVPEVPQGVHATALIGSESICGENVRIAAHCVIGKNVTIGKNVEINAHCVIADDVTIGDDSKLYPHVTVYHGVKIGQRTIIHGGAVIGADGFGMASDQGKWVKIHQLGTVIIGDDVEIGANTTIDRGALENTVIEDGVKIDNQVQIAHNVHIGAHTAIAGCVGIAGSAKIGKYCMIGGGAGINGHIELADRVIIAGMSGVGKTIDTPGVYASGIPAMPHRTWWRILARMSQLESLLQRVEALEKKGE